MTLAPESRPLGTVQAGWADWGRLNRLGLDGVVLVYSQQRAWKWAMIGLLVVLAAEVTLFSFLDPTAGLTLLAVIVIGMPALFLATVALHTSWRLLDQDRVVVLSPSRDAVVDILFRQSGRVSLASHTKLIGSSSAAALRDRVADWLRGLPEHRVKFRAQGRRIADLYIAQFPQLVETGTPNWLGLIELTVPERA